MLTALIQGPIASPAQVLFAPCVIELHNFPADVVKRADG
jgi:hypothetical protein